MRLRIKSNRMKAPRRKTGRFFMTIFWSEWENSHHSLLFWSVHCKNPGIHCNHFYFEIGIFNFMRVKKNCGILKRTNKSISKITPQNTMNKSFFTILFFLFLIFSCRQQSDFIVGNSDEFYIKKAREWSQFNERNVRKTNTGSEKWFRDWDRAEVTTEKNGTKVVIVPSHDLHIDKIHDHFDYRIYFLVRFENNDSVKDSEILHVIKDVKNLSELTLKDIVKGRSDPKLPGFTGYLLRQDSNGEEEILGNKYEDGTQTGVVRLFARGSESGNGSDKRARLNSSQCWEIWLETYNILTGEMIGEQFLYIYCEDTEDAAEGESAGGGTGGSDSQTFDTKCNSFNFAATGANWREAGVNNIFLRIVWWDYGTNTLRVRTVYIDGLVVGFPLAYNAGTPAQVDLSPEEASVWAAEAFDLARSQTYQYLRNYPNATTASISNYFKDRVHAIVSENMGTASFGGSGSPGIPFRNEDRTNFPWQSACD